MARYHARVRRGEPKLWLMVVACMLLVLAAVLFVARGRGRWGLSSSALVALVVVQAATVMIAWTQLLRSRRIGERKRLGLCPRCGYDLTGNASGTCPECGTLVSGAKP